MARKQTNLWRFLKHSLLLAGSVCVAIALASAVKGRAELRRHVVVFRLKPDVGAPDAPMLARAGDIMRERAAMLARKSRLSDITVRPEPPDGVRVSFRMSGDPSTTLAWISLRGQADFCLLHPEDGLLGTTEEGEEPDDVAPPEGYVVRTYYERLYRLSKPGELLTRAHRYLVRASPMLRVEQFAALHFDTSGLHKKTVITFDLPEDQAEQFRNATALNGGRQMILLIDGNAFFPPREIGAAIGGGRVQIQGFFYHPPLRILVKMLQAGSLPARVEGERREQT